MIDLVNRYNAKTRSVPTSLIIRRIGLVERGYPKARGETCGSVDVQF